MLPLAEQDERLPGHPRLLDSYLLDPDSHTSG
jgi:hypothetical protein